MNALRRHRRIAAILYPLFEALLFAVGALAVWLFVDAGDALRSTIDVVLAALVLSIPLASEAAKLFLTEAELKSLDERLFY